MHIHKELFKYQFFFGKNWYQLVTLNFVWNFQKHTTVLTWGKLFPLGLE